MNPYPAVPYIYYTRFRTWNLGEARVGSSFCGCHVGCGKNMILCGGLNQESGRGREGGCLM